MLTRAAEPLRLAAAVVLAVPAALAGGVASLARRWTTLFLSLLLATFGVVALAGPSAAFTVYEIDGRWAPNTPGVVASGDVVTAEWRVNINDSAPAPSNDPVDNVTFSVTLQNGIFRSFPDSCLRSGVTPVSSISPDGRTLTCNLGTHDQGTAVVVQAPFEADGDTGDQVNAVGTIDGVTDEVPPILIDNPFMMDIAWQSPTNNYVFGSDYTDVDLQWTLFLGDGSDPGPNQVSYLLNVNTDTGAALSVGPGACSAFTAEAAVGHPWSGGSHPANQMSPFVGSCSLAPTANPNQFRLTLTGINYSLANVPTHDSAGLALPTDRSAIASGSVWFRVAGAQNDNIQLTSNAPTYQAPNGDTYTDDPANNGSNKVWTRGGWSNAWQPEATGFSTPSWWSDEFRVSPGSDIAAVTWARWGANNNAPNSTWGQCIVLDTAYVEYTSARLTFNWNPNDPVPTQLQYYVGNAASVTPGSGGYNPNVFSCGDDPGGWTTTEPANKALVKAVRAVYPFSALNGHGSVPLQVFQRVKDSTPVGTDVWEWGSALVNGEWREPSRSMDPADAGVLTPNARYPFAATGRDIVRIIGAVPDVRKSVDRTTVRPGIPATFTLTYAANGTGNIPPTVNNYVLRDVLPQGMTYVPNSATPAPQVSTDAQGRQVLTWTLNGVPTNVENALTYQAVADRSASPGERLVNTVTATYGGESDDATAAVTMSTNGYTTISKTADTPFIPNLTGEGDGEGVWSVTLRSFDPLPQAFTDTIDILPFESDARGTDYEGDYSLVAVDAAPGSTVFYTTADPLTLSDDPADPSNGAPNNPVGNTVGWSPVYTPDATAVRVIGPRLDPGATQQFKVRIATDGADGEDLFVNRAQGRAGHTELVMRTSSPMTVANYYAANLKKYVQDVNGKWRDAQDVTDYPAFRYGETVRYRIVVTNVGQGTITNLDVSDDKRPDLGNFHVDSLAPGESESHEFSFVLDESTDGTVVNTACGQADTPPDSQVPPTINCDPAGFEVANYETVKSADPREGSRVLPGQKVTYTVTVTQQGLAPAEAEFSDNLAKVLDDATYNRDVRASLGTARYRSGHLSWNGTIPVGGVATVTYSVTVKDVKRLGNHRLLNHVTSDGCPRLQVSGASLRTHSDLCDTHHEVPRFDLAIDKSVISGTARPGDRVRFRLVVTSKGPDTAPGPIPVRDRLPRGLELLGASGKGWACEVDKRSDVVNCLRQPGLAKGKTAPSVTVVTKVAKGASGRQLVNTACVKRVGDHNPRNDCDPATPPPPPPSTGFRHLPGWF